MDTEKILKELEFKAVRSSGAGGQHVNKTSSKIEAHFNLSLSEAFTEEQKLMLLEKLKSRLSSEGALVLQCGETRSQHRNKRIVIDRLIVLLTESLVVEKPRKATKPSRAAVRKRLKAKRDHSQKKANRKPPPID